MNRKKHFTIEKHIQVAKMLNNILEQLDQINRMIQKDYGFSHKLTRRAINRSFFYKMIDQLENEYEKDRPSFFTKNPKIPLYSGRGFIELEKLLDGQGRD